MEKKKLPPETGVLPGAKKEDFDSFYRKNFRELHEYFRENLEKLLSRGKVLDTDYLLKLDDWLEKAPENTRDRFRREFIYIQVINNFEYINEQILERNRAKEVKEPGVHKPVAEMAKLGPSTDARTKSYTFMSREWLAGVNQNAVYKAIAKFKINPGLENDFNYLYSFSVRLAKMFDLSAELAGCFISNYLLMFAKYAVNSNVPEETENSTVSICTECNKVKEIDLRLTFKPVPAIKARICKECILTIDTAANPFEWDLWTGKAEFSRKKARAGSHSFFKIK